MLSINRENLIFKALNNCLEEGSVEELERRRGYYIYAKALLKLERALMSKKLDSPKLSAKSFEHFEESGTKDLLVKGVSDRSISKVKVINMKQKYSHKHENSP